MLPTPTARDYRGGDPDSPNLNDVIGGSLNPRFVEEMMAFPIGWTAFEPLATPSSLPKPPALSSSCPPD